MLMPIDESNLIWGSKKDVYFQFLCIIKYHHLGCVHEKFFGTMSEPYFVQRAKVVTMVHRYWIHKFNIRTANYIDFCD